MHQLERVADEPVPGSTRFRKIYWASALVVVALSAVYVARYFVNGYGQQDSFGSEPGDEFLVDSYEEGIFREIQQGDYPAILIEDAEGKQNQFGCSDGCPPLDQDPEAYLNRHVRVYLRNLATPGSEESSENAIKVVVRVEVLP
jgi:hypothetical protein